MGVQNLNNIIHTWPASNQQVFHRVIIDGTNLIFNKLSRYLSFLKKQYPIVEWNSINANLIYQTKFIIEQTTDDIVNYINRIVQKYKTVEIFLVFDPKATPSYVIYGDLEDIYDNDLHLRDNPFITNLLTTEELENNEVVALNIKSDEQEIRRKFANKESYIESKIRDIDLLDIDNTIKETIKSIFQQSYHYLNSSKLLRLSNVILDMLRIRFNNKQVYIVHAQNEADLVIKNIALNNVGFNSTLPDEHNTLIISTDTDYYILFSNIPNTYITTLSIDNIYYPFEGWQSLLQGSFSYETVIRLAPMMGNDYTTHKYLITPETNYNDICNLLNINGKFEMIKKNKKKKLYKMIMNYTVNENDLVPLEDIDNMVCEYSKKFDEGWYFKRYLLSVVVYKNWNIYNECEILHNTINEDEMKLQVDGEMENVMKYLFNCHGKLYKWNDSYMFKDWNKFMESVVVVNDPNENYNSVWNALDENYDDADDFVGD